ncbi:MAG: enoyl-CoA hydratase/isomerase family protein [Deltaproteobacteria bacterium]|nr:enoyl-CoA hydratase/isomerase family protein [Deltaproteobacteria bacterium]
MAYEFLLYEVKDEIAFITFNRPKALNALNPQVVQELDVALETIRDDEAVRVVILTGAGEKAFIAGADIKVMSKFTASEGKRFSLYGQGVLAKLGAIPQPVIACVNGYALGGGLEIAMACDFIYAADTALLGQPEISLGIMPGFGGTQRLARRVGAGLTKELCLTGDNLSAAEAKAIGLVNKVFPASELMEETIKTAKKMASKGRVALWKIKTVIEEGYNMDLAKATAIEADRFALCFTSPDQAEGMAAFIEKRKPAFKGGL